MRGRDAAVAAMTAGGLAAVGLGVYFAVVGLDEADKLAGVLGLFIAMAGLVLSVYGVVLARRTSGGSPPSPAQTVAATGDTHNEFTGGSAQQVYMGRDFTIGAPGRPEPPATPGASGQQPPAAT